MRHCADVRASVIWLHMMASLCGGEGEGGGNDNLFLGDEDQLVGAGS